MSFLRIYDASDGSAPLAAYTDPTEVTQALRAAGVRFERWQANRALPADPDEASVLAAYRDDIDRLMREEGYRAVDVIRLTPEHPERSALRERFLSEHTHIEDEVRFFVSGAGLFSLHLGERVYQVLCEAGDLIGVPDRTRHWFDMSESPAFIAIRLFSNPDGWVADYTGDRIADGFPRMMALARTTSEP